MLRRRQARGTSVDKGITELQKACNLIAFRLRQRLSDNVWCSIEADISAEIARMVVHYCEQKHRGDSGRLRTVELDLHHGLPISDDDWLNSAVEQVMEVMNSDSSDLIVPQPLDYLRLCDQAGNTIFEEGKPIEAAIPNQQQQK